MLIFRRGKDIKAVDSKAADSKKGRKRDGIYF